MKKMSIISLILALVLSVTGCLAESVFELLPEENTETVRLQAPSYGAMANAEPERVEQSADGGTIVTYSGVDAAGFNRFGVYLGERGFAATGQEKEEHRLAYSLSDGQVSFVMIYDMEAKTMQLVYPEGTDYEVSLFPGYTQIAFNEEISIPGLGRFTFHDFVLNGDGQSAQYFSSGSTGIKGFGLHAGPVHSWLSFTFHNTSTSYIRYGCFDNTYYNEFFTDSLVYVNQDNNYEYTSTRFGAFDPEKKLIAQGYLLSSDRKARFWNDSCEPLGSKEYALPYDLPDNLRESSDGTIAIKLDFMNGEKYVLVARENGADLNIDAQAAK